jgi:hypothetical protein
MLAGPLVRRIHRADSLCRDRPVTTGWLRRGRSVSSLCPRAAGGQAAPATPRPPQVPALAGRYSAGPPAWT